MAEQRLWLLGDLLELNGVNPKNSYFTSKDGFIRE